jgi:hypothetical protein
MEPVVLVGPDTQNMAITACPLSLLGTSKEKNCPAVKSAGAEEAGRGLALLKMWTGFCIFHKFAAIELLTIVVIKI